jgi:branched-chain amino acid transport system substrate-binding protein
MPNFDWRLGVASAALAIFAATASPSLAKGKYGPGVTDTEIKIGNIMPYSGPASSYSVIGKTEAAYFNMINAEGGINGRKIKFISYDDGYSPPKTVEQARKLVESDHVLLIFDSLGTPTNSAIQRYMNAKKVPQLFVATGATKWNDPKHFHWTMGFQPSYQSEGHIYAHYILKNMPNAKIGVLYQDDDYGKDYLKGLKDGLGAKAAKMIVAEESYETTEPTIDSHIIKLKASGADVFYNASIPKFAAQAIKKAADIGWKETQFLNNVSASINATIKPAGFQNSQGIISSAFVKDPTDSQWKTDPDVVAWNKFLDKWYPGANRSDANVMFGYAVSQAMVDVLKACGNNLTRANVMKQAASMKNVVVKGLLPGIKINTSATDYAPLDQLQLEKFEGQTWKRFGPIISGGVTG